VAASSAGLHEPSDVLQPATIDRHRAVVSIMEELEAVDWYAQRAEAASDGDLASILVHNGNEEKEHAMMVLEWLRRHDPVLDQHMRTYLFTEGPIVGIETAAEEGGSDPQGARPMGAPSGSLGIGSLKVREP
jgi:ferritin-like protein